MSTKVSAARFLRNTEFSAQRAHAEFPNARRILERGLFVSHSGLDTNRIREQLLAPVIHPLVPGDTAFFHNRRSGGSEHYKRLVQAALHWCDKFLVVVSDAAISNDWVVAEVEWATDHSRPMLAVCFDGRRLDELRERADSTPGGDAVQEFDFQTDLVRGQREVAAALRAVLAKYPLRKVHLS